MSGWRINENQKFIEIYYSRSLTWNIFQKPLHNPYQLFLVMFPVSPEAVDLALENFPSLTDVDPPIFRLPPCTTIQTDLHLNSSQILFICNWADQGLNTRAAEIRDTLYTLCIPPVIPWSTYMPAVLKDIDSVAARTPGLPNSPWGTGWGLLVTGILLPKASLTVIFIGVFTALFLWSISWFCWFLSACWVSIYHAKLSSKDTSR